ncbi:MAG: hypothetical protein ACKOTB_01025, partial [Planctomycetia bacterium]
STAVPAAAWATACCLALAAEMAARGAGMLTAPAAAAAARLVVVAVSLCPTMSILGAKRPQHGVWQLIVATLAVVLSLPAAAAVLVRPGSLPDVHLLERCLMPLLVAVGWMNFVGTGRAIAVTSAACGQLILMAGFLPGAATATWTTRPSSDAAAAGLILAAAAVAAGQAAIADRRNAVSGDTSGLPIPRARALIDPAFRGLRETFGAAWALRIMERFDAVAATRGWPCRLRFRGLECPAEPGDPPPDWQRDATRAFRALALRFVNDAWLARHGWQPAAVAAKPAVPDTATRG